MAKRDGQAERAAWFAAVDAGLLAAIGKTASSVDGLNLGQLYIDGYDPADVVRELADVAKDGGLDPLPARDRSPVT